MTVLKSDVPGFICDRYNGHVYLESASRIGNKQKQTPRHHCKNLFILHRATERRGAESKDDRGAEGRETEKVLRQETILILVCCSIKNCK